MLFEEPVPSIRKGIHWIEIRSTDLNLSRSPSKQLTIDHELLTKTVRYLMNAHAAREIRNLSIIFNLSLSLSKQLTIDHELLTKTVRYLMNARAAREIRNLSIIFNLSRSPSKLLTIDHELLTKTVRYFDEGACRTGDKKPINNIQFIAITIQAIDHCP